MSAVVQGSAGIEPMLNSRGQERVRKIQGGLFCPADGVRVPEGYVSDGGSIPRVAWTLIGLHPLSVFGIREWLPHDIRCEFQVGRARDVHDLLYVELEARGIMSPVRRNLVHRAVRTFGPHWKDHEAITVDDLEAIIASRSWGAYDG